MGSLVAQLVKNLTAMQEIPVRFLGWEDPLEKVALVVKNPPAKAGDRRDVGSIPAWEDPLEEEGVATDSSILAWRIPQTEETGGLQSIGFQKSQTRLKRLSTAHT